MHNHRRRKNKQKQSKNSGKNSSVGLPSMREKPQRKPKGKKKNTTVRFSTQKHLAKKTWRKGKIQTQRRSPPPSSHQHSWQNDGGNKKPHAEKVSKTNRTTTKHTLPQENKYPSHNNTSCFFKNLPTKKSWLFSISTTTSQPRLSS